MKKVLLLTGSFGNGHIQVSNSLKAEFKKNYNSEVSIVESDLFLEAHPNLTPILKELYLYSFSYFTSKFKSVVNIIITFFTKNILNIIWET